MAQFIVQGRHSPFTQICIPAERRGRPRRRAPIGHQGKMRRTEGNSGNVATTTKWTPSRRPMCIHVVTFLCRVDSTYLEWPNVLTEPLWTSAKLDCVMRWLKRVQMWRRCIHHIAAVNVGFLHVLTTHHRMLMKIHAHRLPEKCKGVKCSMQA